MQMGMRQNSHAQVRIALLTPAQAVGHQLYVHPRRARDQLSERERDTEQKHLQIG